MRATNFIRLGLSAFLSLILVIGFATGQGKINNKGTWNNASGSTISVATFDNSQGTGSPILNNGGTLNVSNTLINDKSTAQVNNSYSGNAGTINLSGATSVFNNGAGATTNGTTVSSVIKIGNTITFGAGAFSTTAGTVEYTKAGTQTIYATNIASGTYGAIAVRNGTTANAKTIEGSGTTLTVNGTLTIDNDKFVVGGSNTLKIGGSGITTNGTVSFDATTGGGTTVDYTASGSQSVYPTNYVNLSLSGASGTNNSKQAAGAVDITGTLTVSSHDDFDVSGGNALSFSGAAFQVNNSGLIKASGNVTFATAITPTAAGSWDYYGAALQTVGAFAYTNLTLSAGGNKEYQAGTASVSGTYSVTTTGTVDYRANSTTFNYAGTGQTLYAHSYYDLGLTGTGSFGLSTAGLSARTVTVASGATMAITAAGTAQVGYTGQDGTMTVNGGLTLASGTSLTLGASGGPFYGNFTNNGTTMSNDGAITLYGNNTASYKFANASAATFANTTNGSLTVTSADLENDGTFTNSGSITVN